MSAIFILLLASLGIALAFVAVFVWAVRSGQYDDTVTPAMRMISDDDQTVAKANPSHQGGHKKGS